MKSSVSEIYIHVVRWKSTYVSEKYIASTFSSEVNKEASMKQVPNRDFSSEISVNFLWTTHYILQDGTVQLAWQMITGERVCKYFMCTFRTEHTKEFVMEKSNTKMATIWKQSSQEIQYCSTPNSSHIIPRSVITYMFLRSGLNITFPSPSRGSKLMSA